MIKMNFLKIVQALLGRCPFPGQYCCNICGHRLSRFLPYNGKGNTVTLPKVLGVVGSDTKNFECPWCGAHDRERHLLMYMRTVGLFDSMAEKSILHFAPEPRLSRFISAEKPARYVQCDLYPASLDIERVDVMEIPYADMGFDLVIANHILEHVENDVKALEEIYRILKPSGYAILQTPFSPKLHGTWSDKGVDGEQARLVAYGQEDHVRLFGRDIFDRFSAVGFVACVKQHNKIIPKYDPRQYGVNVLEPFFLFKRDEKRVMCRKIP